MARVTSTHLRLAATAVPVRDGDEGIEVLVVKRCEQLSFGGLWTFPGGGLEPGDGPAPADLDEAIQDWRDPALLLTAGRAAVRETFEETRLVCDPSRLVWLSHWIPPVVNGPPKRFATWFFLTAEPTGELELDLAENTEARWIDPAAALLENAAGGLPIVAPTWVTLHDLARFGSVADAADAAAHTGAVLFHTRSVRVDGELILMWPGDVAYESGDPTVDGARNRAVVAADGVVRSRDRSS